MCVIHGESVACSASDLQVGKMDASSEPLSDRLI